MIILDLDMPKNCASCNVLAHCGEADTYLTDRPGSCPIVGEIEDVKDIKNERN